MNTYYLQHGADGRVFIDCGINARATHVKESRMAASWLAAKKAFGFWLTPVQERLEAERLAK